MESGRVGEWERHELKHLPLSSAPRLPRLFPLLFS
jgi:hypothetical protein